MINYPEVYGNDFDAVVELVKRSDNANIGNIVLTQYAQHSDFEWFNALLHCACEDAYESEISDQNAISKAYDAQLERLPLADEKLQLLMLYGFYKLNSEHNHTCTCSLTDHCSSIQSFKDYYNQFGNALNWKFIDDGGIQVVLNGQQLKQRFPGLELACEKGEPCSQE